MFFFFSTRFQVFEFLIRRHSADSSDEEEVFPFIRTLLHFDTREFLNVLAMVRMSVFTAVVFPHIWCECLCFCGIAVSDLLD